MSGLERGALALVATIALSLGCGLAQGVARGDELVDDGDFEGAVAAYREALELDPDDVRAHVRLARATTYLAGTLEGDAAARTYAEAADVARRAIALREDVADAHFELSRALGRLAQFRGVLQTLNLAQEVRAALDRTLELEPEHDGALHALALWHLNVPWYLGGNRGRVRGLFERAISIAPDSISHRFGYAEALLELGDEAEAHAQLAVALELPARTHLERGYQEEARELSAGPAGP